MNYYVYILKSIRDGKFYIGQTNDSEEEVRALGWRERQRVKVTRIKGGLQIKDYRSKK